MTLIEVVLLGVALAMDAFAVSVTEGLKADRFRIGDAVIIALYFGAFQFFMPILGWFLGGSFISFIESWDHWLAFFLLLIIGGKNIIDAVKESDDSDEQLRGTKTALNHKELFLMAIATSIDALAVGITLSITPGTNIWFDVVIIGVVTFIICFAGFIIGRIAGFKFKKQASIIGGLILIIIGTHILLEGLGIL